MTKLEEIGNRGTTVRFTMAEVKGLPEGERTILLRLSALKDAGHAITSEEITQEQSHGRPDLRLGIAAYHYLQCAACDSQK